MCITLPFGVLFLFCGLYLLGRGVFLTLNGLTVPGVVARMEGRNSGKRTFFHPVVRFRTRAGQELEFTGTTGGGIDSYDVGEPVQVLYNPARPRSACIRSFSELWLGALVWSSVGALCLLAYLLGEAHL